MESKILDKKRLPITSLHEFQGDFKTLGKKQFEKLKKSIEKNGFIQPFFIWNKDGKYYILDGHQRKKAIIDLYGETIDVDCLEIKADSELEAKKFVLYYSTSYAEFDKDSFFNFADGLSFDDLEAFQFPGFSFSENDFLKGLNNDQDDEIPEVAQNEMGVQLGEVYTLGEHRLMCGDSTDTEMVQSLMDGNKADMVFTDPPYGVDYEGIHNDSRNGLEDLLDLSFQNYNYFTNPGSGIYVFHSDKCADIFHRVFRKYFHFSSMIIWVKPAIVLSQTDYQSKHEPIIYGWVKGESHKFYGDRKQTSLWEFGKEEKLDHTTPKPTALIKNALMLSSETADVVLDLFGGSGSTLIACEKTKRKCYMMELDPHYCSVIIKRWEKYTGQKAVKCE